jgi:hypothetical protein
VLVLLRHKLQRLKNVIETYEPVAPMAIQYMYYDVFGTKLNVHTDPGYSEELKELCLPPIVA